MPSTLAKKRLRKKLQRRAHARSRAHARTRKHSKRRPREYRDEHVVQPPAVPPKPDPKPPGGGKVPQAPDASHRNAERLLWRAGFGPRPGDVEHVVSIGIPAAVKELVHPTGAAKLIGPEPRDEDGNELAPYDAWAHDHVWWLDRMVRSNQPLVERMTLIWHDWFATSNDKVGNQRMMIDQNELMRTHALGSFADLLEALTIDPAMLLWLDGIENRSRDVNENYAREVMELFTLGADRGYTEQDVRELARAFTGWRADWVDGTGWTNFRFDTRRHDANPKTIFGQTGDYDWQDAVRLCLENPYHASFFVTKLWSYFIPTPPDAATQARLQKLYLDSGYGIAPVVEAILKHPALYADRALVKSPVVYNAGLLRRFGRGITTTAWGWLGNRAGQQLFWPPNVAGWDDSSWLDTSSWRARSQMVSYIFQDLYIEPWEEPRYDPKEDASTALTRALKYTGNPYLSKEMREGLLAFAGSCLPRSMEEWEHGPFRAMRQNALRHLILTCSDWQAS
jgi:Protein of unknown function (DUF1800)